MTNIEKRWDLAGGKPLLAKPGSLYISFLKEGGEIEIKSLPKGKGLQFKWTNPKNGKVVDSGSADSGKFNAPDNTPWVLIIN